MEPQTKKQLSKKRLSCSGYSLYVGKNSGVIDFTEKKLLKIADECVDEQKKIMVLRLLHDYMKGYIAIAWENGDKPVYIFSNKIQDK